MKKKLLLLLMCFYVSTIFSQNFKFGKVSKEELAEKIHPLDSAAKAAYLYKNKVVYYDLREGMKIITDVVQRIKIYNKDGFDYATFLINYYRPETGKEDKITSIKATTYNLKSNGKIEKTKISKKNIFDEKRNKYRHVKKITMPNVKEGSVIEIKYKLISPYSSIDDMQFQHDIPVNKLDYMVTIPEYYTYTTKSKGYYFVNETNKIGTGSVVVKTRIKQGAFSKKNTQIRENKTDYATNIKEYKASNIPALKNDEPYVNNINNYRSGMKFELAMINFTSIGGEVKQYSTSWQDVSRQILRSSNFGVELNKSSYYKADLQNILSAVKTDTEKIGAIFQFVKNKVKWSGYYGIAAEKGVRKAYKEGSGNVADINLMLTSMLRSAGLDANPVLVSSRTNGIPLSPTTDGFNYVIASVNLPNGYVLLDATEFYSMPNILPLRALNWRGRLIKKDKSSSWIELASNTHAIKDNLMSIKINEDFSVAGRLRTTFKNIEAVNYRSTYNHVKEESVINLLEERFGVEIDDYKITNKREIYKPVVRNMSFNGEDFIEMINGKVYISPLFFLTTRVNPFKLEDRKFAVDYGTPLKNKNSIFIQIPKGYKVESVPESFTVGIRDNKGVYGFKVVVSGSKINVISQLQINSGKITPEYYKDLKEFYNQMVKKQIEKIVLVKE